MIGPFDLQFKRLMPSLCHCTFHHCESWLARKLSLSLWSMAVVSADSHALFLALVGRTKMTGIMYGMDHKDSHVGDCFVVQVG